MPMAKARRRRLSSSRWERGLMSRRRKSAKAFAGLVMQGSLGLDRPSIAMRCIDV